MEVEPLTMVFLLITGQKFATCPNISSRWVTFCMAVRPAGWPSPESGSLVKPQSGVVLFFFSHTASLARNAEKLLSSDNVYTRFWRQFSKVVIVSWVDKLHCFGARFAISEHGYSIRHCATRMSFLRILYSWLRLISTIYPYGIFSYYTQLWHKYCK